MKPICMNALGWAISVSSEPKMKFKKEAEQTDRERAEGMGDDKDCYWCCSQAN